MTLKTTISTMRKLIDEIQWNLAKSERGNKTASKRTRMATIRFAKIAKLYRKESVEAGKKGGARRS
jgi:hypothetical protein